MGNQNFTSLLKFKSWYDFKGSAADDQLINDLIQQSSMDLLAYLARKSLLKSTYTEYSDGTGGGRILLRQWPVLSVTLLTDTGTTIPATSYAPNTSPPSPPGYGYFLDPWDGTPPGSPQYLTAIGANFRRGRRNICATYVAGFLAQAEPATVPAKSPFTVKAMQQFGLWSQDEGVTNSSTGAALTKVTGVPTTGQYAVNEGVYTFAAADTGNAVLLNYDYVPATLERACREMVGERYAYRPRIGQKSQSFQGNVTATYDNSGLTDFVKNMVQPYKRMTPA